MPSHTDDAESPSGGSVSSGEAAGPPIVATEPVWREIFSPHGLVGIAWCIFQIGVALWPYVDELVTRCAHVSFALALALLWTSRKSRRPIKLFNFSLALLALAPPFIIWASLARINDRTTGLDPLAPLDYAGALIILVLLFEISRRVLGVGMTALAFVFVAYQFFGGNLPGLLSHNAADFTEFIDIQFLTIEGVFGVPTGVSVRLVFYFILFAAVFETFGGGKMIIDLSLALTGARKGGPAKAAVVASGLMGSVSGSAVANVMSTGIFTIPLMKRIKYDARFAGAVEAVASTGGQIMPPVMGAAAFVMADFLQVPYGQIVIAAALPALLYFVCVLISVDLEARRRGLPTIGREEIPRIGQTLKNLGHMMVPLGWLTYRIVAGYDITALIIEVIGLTIAVGTLRRSTRVGPAAVLTSLVTAATRSINVAIPCALASLIVSVIAFTSLGTKFTSMILNVAGGEVTVLLGLAMAATLILGAGMPTTSAYIMGAVLIAPALIEFGTNPLVAHFFVFYFAIMSMLTPPVALSAYAAASISGSSPSATGWQALLLALPGFIIPYAIVINPGLLLVGPIEDTLLGLFSVLIGLCCVSAAVIGWLFKPLSIIARVFVALAAVGVLWPQVWVSLSVGGVLIVGSVWLYLTSRREAKVLDAPLC